ncbi:MAG TPA: sulfate ABC transporter permease subunit CysT, partial [Thermoanaerobaculia bacterium]
MPVSARRGGGRRHRGGSVLPGFGLSLGFTLFYLGLVILIPLSTVVLKTASLTWVEFWAKVSAPRTLAAFR